MECTKGKTLRVLSSAAGYYIGILDKEGFPFCRASEEYYTLREEATAVLELLEQRDMCGVRVLRLGYPDMPIPQGEQSELRALLGLDASGIVASVKQFIG